MNDGYAFDARDAFKVELLDALMTSNLGFEQLTAIWMLTEPSPTKRATRAFTWDPELPELSAFFQARVASGHRRIRDLGPYFTYRYNPHYDLGPPEGPPYFTNLNRHAYFTALPDAALRRALVFFDPDTGMERQNGLWPEYLSFAELKETMRRMGSGSLAIVYQHWQHRPWESMADRLRRYLDLAVACLAEPANVGFYVVAGQAVDVAAVSDALRRLARRKRRVFLDFSALLSPELVEG